MGPKLDWSAWFQRYRFIALFFTLLAFLVAVPLLHEMREFTPLAPIAPAAVILLPVLTLVLVSIGKSGWVRLGTMLFALVGVGLWAMIPQDPYFGYRLAQHLAGIGFIGFGIGRILAHLFSNRRVTFDLICASLCVYLLFGVLWALGYSLMMCITPTAFEVSGKVTPDEMRIDRGNSAEVLYFSYATLTTLGYGDIVPRSPLTRMLATLEALVGQLYLTVLVARLVGMHIADQDRDEELPSV